MSTSSQRLAPLDPSTLTGEQRELHDYMTGVAESTFGPNGKKFIWADAKTGGMVGPFRAMLDLPPAVAKHFLSLAVELTKAPGLAGAPREVAILATGVHYRSKYELYAHTKVAETTEGITHEQIQQVLAGQRPTSDETGKLGAAWDVTQELLVTRGPLSDEAWKKAEQAFGRKGALLIVQFVGAYAYTSIHLNAADMPVPE